MPAQGAPAVWYTSVGLAKETTNRAVQVRHRLASTPHSSAKGASSMLNFSPATEVMFDTRIQGGHV